MKWFLKYSALSTIILSGCIVLLLFLLSSALTVLNKQIQKEYYGIKNSIANFWSHPNILLVGLDEKSLKEIWSFPISRTYYADIIKNLWAYRPAVIAFDFLFLDPSSTKADSVFKESIESFDALVFGTAMSSWDIFIPPHTSLWVSDDNTGFLSPNVEQSNNTVYSFAPILWDALWNEREHFTIKIIRQFYNAFWQDDQYLWEGKRENGGYQIHEDLSIPLSRKDSKEVLINFIPPANFPRVSFQELFDPKNLEDIDKEYQIKDKIILIWPAADGFNDEFYTPNGREYGMYVHANILNTILSKQYMMYFDRFLEWLMIFFLIILSVFINLSRNTKLILFWNISIIAVFWILFPISILLGTNLILNFPSEIILSLLFSFTAANIVKFIIEDRNKRKLNAALSEYVSKDIAEEVLAGDGAIKLDGEKRELVCFFSDIEWFTSMSERIPPETLVTFLREYLGEMTDVIMWENGHVDKFEWDAIMALWWAFNPVEDIDCLKACKVALMQQKALKNIHMRWNTVFENQLKVRIWIHAGNAIVWNIWAPGQKMEFTAIWDNINLASRLEGVNKFYGSYICVSEEIYTKTKAMFSYRYLDTIQVKGKDIPVKIYELRGYITDMTDADHSLIEKFDKGIHLYKTQQFEKALNIFQELASSWDAPSQTYIQRCQEYLKDKPAASWDAVWRMSEK